MRRREGRRVLAHERRISIIFEFRTDRQPGHVPRTRSWGTLNAHARRSRHAPTARFTRYPGYHGRGSIAGRQVKELLEMREGRGTLICAHPATRSCCPVGRVFRLLPPQDQRGTWSCCRRVRRYGGIAPEDVMEE